MRSSIQGRAYPQRRGDRVSGSSCHRRSSARWRFRWSPAVDSPRAISKVRRLWRDQRGSGTPLLPQRVASGRRFRSEFGEGGEVEIVGILRDAKYNSIRAAAPPTLYRPFGQAAQVAATFEVRTSGDPLAAIAGRPRGGQSRRP